MQHVKKIYFIFLKTGLIGCLLFLINCREPPFYPQGKEFPIYSQTLMQGFDIGVDDSKHQCNWLINMGDYMRMEYPEDLDWGCVFIVVGMVPYQGLYEDFTKYKSLSIDLRGKSQIEEVEISLEDDKNQSHYTELISDIENDWKSFPISLEKFSDINFQRLRVVIKFIFYGNVAQTIDFKNLVYSTNKTITIPPKTSYIVRNGKIVCGCDIGCNTSTGLTNLIVQENTHFKINFPAHQEWAIVFVYCDPSLNLSMYNALSIEIKGELGGEIISIGLSDTLGETLIKTGKISWEFPKIWDCDTFSLYNFKDVNLSKIYIPIQFINRDTIEKTIYFKNIKYIHK